MVGTDPDSDGLLPMALSRPREALARARRILAGRPAPALASVAHQAAGVVLREFGDVRAGLAELRTALRLARQTGSVEREADVLAALGIALVYTGRTTAGLADLNRAFELASGTLAGRVLHRRGVVLLRLGQYAAALDDLSAAVVILQRDGDRLWGWMLAGDPVPGPSPHVAAYWDAITWSRGRGLGCDFGGAPTSGIRDFKIAMGGEPEPCSVAERVRPQSYKAVRTLHARLASRRATARHADRS